MTDSTAYSVIVSGECQAGFTAEQVCGAFATLFNISPEKASALLKGQQVIKKGIDLKSAELYKRKLESIGLVVSLRERKSKPAAADALSLTPTTDDHSSASPSVIVTCPKCKSQQPPGTDQCQKCGVYMHKVVNTNNTGCTHPVKVEDLYIEPDVAMGESLTAKSLVIGAAAALVGALVWSFIANISGYELGLVAWGIGGVIGFAVIASGSSGLKTGIACGILAMAAILGGKYMIYSGVQDELAAALAGSREQVHAIYDVEMEAASAYAGVMGDRSRRQFMIDYQYTDSSTVSDEELESFMETDGMRLSSYVDFQPSFDDWYQDNVATNLENLSTFELIRDDLGLIDIIFFLLGIGTAFRLGRGESM